MLRDVCVPKSDCTGGWVPVGAAVMAKSVIRTLVVVSLSLFTRRNTNCALVGVIPVRFKLTVRLAAS